MNLFPEDNLNVVNPLIEIVKRQGKGYRGQKTILIKFTME